LKKVNDFTAEEAKNIFTIDQIAVGVEKLKNFQWPKFSQGDSVDDFIEKISKKLTANLGAFPSLVTPIPQRKLIFQFSGHVKFIKLKTINYLQNFHILHYLLLQWVDAIFLIIQYFMHQIVPL
jgi:hypothetical protein